MPKPEPPNETEIVIALSVLYRAIVTITEGREARRSFDRLDDLAETLTGTADYSDRQQG